MHCFDSLTMGSPHSSSIEKWLAYNFNCIHLSFFVSLLFCSTLFRQWCYCTVLLYIVGICKSFWNNNYLLVIIWHGYMNSVVQHNKCYYYHNILLKMLNNKIWRVKAIKFLKLLSFASIYVRHTLLPSCKKGNKCTYLP